jgi:hypothetical protein
LGCGLGFRGQEPWGRIGRMSRATPFLAALLAVVAVTSSAHAQQQRQQRQRSSSTTTTPKQTYKWVDENGVTHYGDSVPSQYSQREHRVLNSQGVEVQKRLAEMSPKEAAEYQARQREEARRKQHDMFLITTYPSVGEIENIRDARLEQINAQIMAAEAYIASLTTRVDGLKQRALNFAPYNTRPNARRMPDDLAEEMVRAMSELRTQNSALNAKRTEFKSVQDQFATDITRYKELRGTTSARLKAIAPKE